MPNGGRDRRGAPPPPPIDALCRQFESDWRAGARPRIEELLADAAAEDVPALLGGLLELEWRHRRQLGEAFTPEEYSGRFAGEPAVVADAWCRWRGAAGGDKTPPETPPPT